MQSIYAIEIDTVDKDAWTKIIQGFDDASVFQTWSWGALRWGEKNLSHAVLRKQGEIVAAAQSWIIKIPVLNAGIAFIKWGPLWQRREKEQDREVLLMMLRALKEEYIQKRGLLLRIVPNKLINDENVDLMIEAEGFSQNRSNSIYRTLVLGLSRSLDEIRRNFKRTWRQNLEKAEKCGLHIIEGENDDLFKAFIMLYKDMIRRKKFADFLNPNSLRFIQRDLPDNLKMKIFICCQENNPVAGVILSKSGNSAVQLMRASNTKGLKLRAPYRLEWYILEWLKKNGCLIYDLGGIGPNNPGVDQFKAGLGGKAAKDITFKEFEFCQNIKSLFIVKMGDYMRNYYRNAKQILSGFRRM